MDGHLLFVVAAQGVWSRSLVGPGKTVLSADEVLISLALAPVPPRSATTYLRFTPRREMDIAIAGVAVRIDLAEDRTIALARIALASVGPTPLRALPAERLLQGNRPEPALAQEAALAAAGAANAQTCPPQTPVQGAVPPGPLPLFPATNWWNLDVRSAPVEFRRPLRDGLRCLRCGSSRQACILQLAAEWICLCEQLQIPLHSEHLHHS